MEIESSESIVRNYTTQLYEQNLKTGDDSTDSDVHVLHVDKLREAGGVINRTICVTIAHGTYYTFSTSPRHTFLLALK